MYLNRRFYIGLGCLIGLFIISYLLPPLFLIGKGLLALFVLLAGWDALFLYRRVSVNAYRQCADRFSNGDENRVTIRVENESAEAIHVEVIDEMPVVFQERNVSFRLSLLPGEGKQIVYQLRPKERGIYAFGLIRVFVSGPLGLLSRRFSAGTPQEVKVYPSFLMLHKYELLAMSNNLTELGIKRIRRIGHQTEFEQIKEYVKGDDYRTVNWKATARRRELMVNVFQDERSQQIYSVIDKGRVMQQAFRGMTLLDYAMNASLVLSYVAMRKEDKAGLITFNERFEGFVPASKQTGQLQTLLETLYSQQTSFGETDYSALCVHLDKHVTKRSLLVLYTNFSDLGSLNRQLAYLQQLSQRHRLLVVFFEDEELKAYAEHPATDTEGYYRRVIAQKFVYEKRVMVSTLRQCGIQALLTTPDQLSVGVINKYLEMKARQLI